MLCPRSEPRSGVINAEGQIIILDSKWCSMSLPLICYKSSFLRVIFVFLGQKLCKNSNLWYKLSIIALNSVSVSKIEGKSSHFESKVAIFFKVRIKMNMTPIVIVIVINKLKVIISRFNITSLWRFRVLVYHHFYENR